MTYSGSNQTRSRKIDFSATIAPVLVYPWCGVLIAQPACATSLNPGSWYWPTAAALVTTLACHLRLAHWLNRADPLWYLEAVIFFCSIVLWGFVFAWHTPYTRRPVLTLKIEPRLFVAVTLVGIVGRRHVSPVPGPGAPARKLPEEYPADLEQWLALMLFSLAFNQLFLVFAPFAWLVRLFHNPGVAIVLTVLFGAVVLAIKIHSTPALISPAIVRGAPGRSDRHGFPGRHPLLARRAAPELVVDTAC